MSLLPSRAISMQPDQLGIICNVSTINWPEILTHLLSLALSLGMLMLACVALLSMVPSIIGFTILGTGTGSLIGGDLTDPLNIGDESLYAPPSDYGGFEAEFFANDKPAFGTREQSFNVFDNRLGPGDDKSCCGTLGFPQIVGARLLQGRYFLTSFTVSSANDTPNRDPRVWRIEGSNDGANYTLIYERNNVLAQVWTARLQVIEFVDGIGGDFPDQMQAYEYFRMVTLQTGTGGGNPYQVGEIELFGELDLPRVE